MLLEGPMKIKLYYKIKFIKMIDKIIVKLSNILTYVMTQYNSAIG